MNDDQLLSYLRSGKEAAFANIYRRNWRQLYPAPRQKIYSNQYRYADVLLLAESLHEQGKTGEAIRYVNPVRERAGLAAAMAQPAMRDALAQER